MVDQALKELVRRLPAADNAELRAFIDDELADDASPELSARLDARRGNAMESPDDCVSIDEDERALRTRRHIA